MSTYDAGFVAFSVCGAISYGMITRWAKPSQVSWLLSVWLVLVVLAIAAISYHNTVSEG